MKKIVIGVLMGLMGVTGVGMVIPNGGCVFMAERNVGESDKYTPEELNTVMELVEEKFKKDFNGCTLLELEYDEEFSDRTCEGWAEQYDADRAIVLTSEYFVDFSGGDGSLNENSMYTDWQWILTQDDNGEWTLQTWGY